LGSSSIEDAAVEVYDADGTLRVIVGQLPDGTSGAVTVNGPVPPTPTAPVVTSALAALRVRWDGAFVDAVAAPLDWARVEVHVGPFAAFVPGQATLWSTIETAQGGEVLVTLPYTQWWVRLRARSLSGAAGPATVAVAGTPAQAGAGDIVAGAITTEKLAAAAITGQEITGGTITGAEIIGGRFATGAEEQRIEIESRPVGEGGSWADITFYSGSDSEMSPGSISAKYTGMGECSLLLESPFSANPLGQEEDPEAGGSPSSASLTDFVPWISSIQLTSRWDFSEATTVGVIDMQSAHTSLGQRASVQESFEASTYLAGSGGVEGVHWDEELVTPLLLNRGVVIDANGWVSRVSGGAWQALTPINGWGAAVAPDAPPMVRRTIDRMLEFSGRMTPGTAAAGTTVFNMPAGWLPAGRRQHLVATGNSVARLEWTIDGRVIFYLITGTLSWLSLDGVRIRLD